MNVGSLERLVADMNNGVYDLTCNGECTQCGNCCSNLLPMSESEIATIHKYIKKNHIKEHRHNYPLSQRIIDATCPFLNDDKPKEKCDIYSVRPKICKDFICCPDKRKKPDLNTIESTKIVDVRKEFYG